MEVLSTTKKTNNMRQSLIRKVSLAIAGAAFLTIGLNSAQAQAALLERV
jgi:hypothetical protein